MQCQLQCAPRAAGFREHLHQDGAVVQDLPADVPLRVEAAASGWPSLLDGLLKGLFCAPGVWCELSPEDDGCDRGEEARDAAGLALTLWLAGLWPAGASLSNTTHVPLPSLAS